MGNNINKCRPVISFVFFLAFNLLSVSFSPRLTDPPINKDTADVMIKTDIIQAAAKPVIQPRYLINYSIPEILNNNLPINDDLLKIGNMINLTLMVDKKLSIKIARSIYKYLKGSKIKPELIVSIIKVESHGRPRVISRAGAMGLMQIMPFWKKVMKMEKANLFDPDTNIKMGIYILAHYLKRYKKIETALAAYNGSVRSKKYPRKIFRVYKNLIEEFAV